jgi:alanyl-tRNA synthetase
MAQERGMTVDVEGFNRLMEEAREKSRQGGGRTDATQSLTEIVQRDNLTGTRFLGYDHTECTVMTPCRVYRLAEDGYHPAQNVWDGDQVAVVVGETPFYAESGGQVGDTGLLTSESGRARVLDTRSPLDGVVIHEVELEYGRLETGETVQTLVDTGRRNRIRANHTGTHLLHAALRRTLGVHVKQAGSLVAPDRLRFDYTHYAALTPDQIDEVESIVNRVILDNTVVETREMGLDEAVEAGAIAFFGEKYKQHVRVVNVGDFSMELCGGTHTSATGDIGMFKILGESSVAAGVRRIEAITGMGVYERLGDDERLIHELASRTGSSRSDLPRPIDRATNRTGQVNQ